MDDSQPTVTDNNNPEVTEPAQLPTIKTYDSNPFTSAWAGLQKLVKTNAQLPDLYERHKYLPDMDHRTNRMHLRYSAHTVASA